MTRMCRAVLMFTLCLAGGSAAMAADPLTKVRVAHWGHEKVLIYAPLYVAAAGGFFEREGLDVELVYSGNDDQVFATVLSGSAQFGVGDPAFTAISRERGGEGKVIAQLVGRVANWALAKDPKFKPFTDPRGLAGLRVTSFPAPSTTFTILSSIKQKYQLSGMQIVQIAFGSEQAAVSRGDADVAMMLEPQASVAETQGWHEVWSLANYYGDFVLTGVTAADSFLKAQPQIAQHFVNALQGALNYAAADPAGAAALIESAFPDVPQAVLRSATQRMVRDQTIPRSTRIDSAVWRRTLELRVSVGDLKSLDSANDSLDDSFADNAMHAAAPQGSAATATSVAPHRQAEAGGGEPLTGWVILARSADILAVVGILSFIATISVGARYRRAWNRLYEFDEPSGAVIRKAFPSRVATVSEANLVRVLQEKCGHSQVEARKILAEFCKAGILKASRAEGGTEYRPRINVLTNSVALFDLWG